MITRFVLLLSILSALHATTLAQEVQSAQPERNASLAELAIALDGLGQPALEGTLLTTALNGGPETPVTNISLMVKNVSAYPYSFISGVATFYAANGVRCGAGIFKADVLAVNETFETDTPGIRITCEPATWRLVATHLVPRGLPAITPTLPAQMPSSRNLIISIDGQDYPLQLDRPLILSLGNQSRRIVVRQGP